jgi:hypothetical protein
MVFADRGNKVFFWASFGLAVAQGAANLSFKTF